MKLPLLLLFMVARCVLADFTPKWKSSDQLEVSNMVSSDHGDRLDQILEAVQSLLPLKQILMSKISQETETYKSELKNATEKSQLLEERLAGMEREALQFTITNLQDKLRCAEKQQASVLDNARDQEKQNCELRIADLKTQQTKFDGAWTRIEALLAQQNKSSLTESRLQIEQLKNTSYQLRLQQQTQELKIRKFADQEIELKAKLGSVTAEKLQLSSALKICQYSLANSNVCCSNLSKVHAQKYALDSQVGGLNSQVTQCMDESKNLKYQLNTLKQNCDANLQDQKASTQRCERKSNEQQSQLNELIGRQESLTQENAKLRGSRQQVTQLCKGKGTGNLVKLGKGSYYFVQHLRLSWHAAEKYCRAIGLDLVSIESEEENQLIINHLLATGLEYEGYEGFYWTSGTDIASEGQYYWSATGQDMKFTFWHPGQPDNLGDEDCVELWHVGAAGNIRWNDRTCSWAGRFICELNEACS